MTIAVLTHKPRSYSSIRLVEEAGKLGVPCELVSFRETSLHIKEGRLRLKVFDGAGVRAVFSRPKTLLSPLMLYALSLTKILEEEGLYVLNPFEGFLNTLDKVVTYRNLCLENLPIPDSIMSASWRRLVEMPSPFFLKPVYGSRGRGVKLVEKVEEKPIVEGCGAWIAQSSAKEDNWDLRILVLGDQVLAAIKRVSDKPVTNIARGAVGEIFEADREVEKLAVKASKALNCLFAGVDISFRKGEAFILDVNPQPDFMGVEKTMGINVAREIINYMLTAAGD
ncbi:MAG: ATP-grasp domain-containing protein [Thermoproteota archaeon]